MTPEIHTWLCDRVAAFQGVSDLMLYGVPLAAPRHSRWGCVRQEHLLAHPVCEVCGGHQALRAHHIQPFHLHPELELEPSNLITLCESKRYGLNCHLLIGHLGNYKRINPMVRGDAETWRLKLIKP